MGKIIKKILLLLVVLVLLATATIYGALTISLPSLDGATATTGISQSASLSRDHLGHAVIQAENRHDAAYALGYAHSQDRFFQMDLLRRSAAGELSELFGDAALSLDKENRFHQFRKRAEKTLTLLSESDLSLLEAYAQGVNEAQAHIQYPSFEYLLTGAERKPWQPADSLLVIYAMYLDLQAKNYERELTLTMVEARFGHAMRMFLTQPSKHQAALDGSELPLEHLVIPKLVPSLLTRASTRAITEPSDIGSNNWAVTGALTSSGHAMLADDMHLSLRVPVIWYRAQLNYKQAGKNVSVTGVSLPGAPAIVVGTNGHLAWGFTNGYIDQADWYKLDADTPRENDIEIIKSTSQNHEFIIEKTALGPVKLLNQQKYALTWVAHQDYAVNLALLDLETAHTVADAQQIAPNLGIPVQNMMLVDSQGNAAWQLGGAVSSRVTPSEVAVSQQDFNAAVWQQKAESLANVVNPEDGRLWTANSRVVGVNEHSKYGNGGYALGARAEQIKQRMYEKSQFNEADFYQIQIDNQALFLKPWQQLLLKVLNTDAANHQQDIELVTNWGECACPDSVGYTLVRYFRSYVIDAVFAPLETELHAVGLSLSPIKNDLEPAVWQLIEQFPDSWLTSEYASWPELLLTSYTTMRKELLIKHTGHVNTSLTALNWGAVNAMKLQHPFSKQMPQLSKWLDMPVVAGFGDSFMPAVQKPSFGASQRLFVQPGLEQNAILALPGGQSGHPLSPFYRAGFSDYAAHKSTPLLPGTLTHKIEFSPQ
jgi:penicillin amidase